MRFYEDVYERDQNILDALNSEYRVAMQGGR